MEAMHLIPDYEKRKKDRRLTKWVLRSVVCILVVVAVLLLGPDWWTSISNHYWRYKAGAYRVSRDHVVYDDNPQAASRLAQQSDRYRRLKPDLGQAFPDEVPLPTAFYPDIGKRFIGELPFVFLHRREAVGQGYVTFVAISLKEISPSARALYLRANSIGLKSDALGRGGMDILLSAADHLRIFAGQPDSADASRFFIDYELNGNRGQIVGQVRADGDIELSIVGPLETRSPERE
jgi:hypothetical protein